MCINYKGVLSLAFFLFGPIHDKRKSWEPCLSNPGFEQG